jgi:hypothetical protein
MQIRKMKLYGNAVTHAMRSAYERNELEALIEMVPDMTVKDALSVCTGKAQVIGNSEDGFEVEYK